MYGKQGNQFTEPHGTSGGDTTSGKTTFICTADVKSETGVIGRCGTRFEVGMCCHNQQFHLERPKPFVQKMHDGDHHPGIMQMARAARAGTGVRT